MDGSTRLRHRFWIWLPLVAWLPYACSESEGGGRHPPASCETCTTHDDCPALSCPCANLPFNGTIQSCRGGCCATSCDEFCVSNDGGSGASTGVGGSTGATGGSGGDPGPTICPEEGNTILATDQPEPNGIALDADNVYWTSNYGSVSKLAKSGGSPTVIITDSRHISGARDIIERDGVLYFGTSSNLAAISNAGELLQLVNITFVFNTPTSFGVDATTIWVGGNQGLATIPIGGDSASSFLDGESCFAEGMVVDDDDVYWAGCDLWRVPKSGPPKQLVATGGHLLDGLAADSDNLYYIDPTQLDGTFEGDVMTVPKTGGTPVTLAPDEPQGRLPVLADGELYWTTFEGTDCSGSIRKIDVAAPSAVTTVVSGITYVTALAVDATSVYFTSGGDKTVRVAPR